MDNNTLSLIYVLEKEFGSIGNVPEDNLKLKILRERVNRVNTKKIPGKIDRYNDILLMEISRLLLRGYSAAYCANRLRISYSLVNTFINLYDLSNTKYYAVIDNARYYADTFKDLHESIKSMNNITYTDMRTAYYNHRKIPGMKVGLYKKVRRISKNEAIELVNLAKEKRKKNLRSYKHG